jgi:flagellar biosynthesis protein FlhB
VSDFLFRDIEVVTHFLLLQLTSTITTITTSTTLATIIAITAITTTTTTTTTLTTTVTTLHYFCAFCIVLIDHLAQTVHWMKKEIKIISIETIINRY